MSSIEGTSKHQSSELRLTQRRMLSFSDTQLIRVCYAEVVLKTVRALNEVRVVYYVAREPWRPTFGRAVAGQPAAS